MYPALSCKRNSTLFSILLVLVVLFCPLLDAASAALHELTYQGVKYIMNDDGTWGLYRGTGNEADNLSIPYSIDGIPVTSICSEPKVEAARIDCTSLKLPGSIASINAGAFLGCEINEIYLSEGTTQVKDYAFYANHLKKVTLPASLTHIGDSAFDYIVDLNLRGKGTTFYVVKGSYAEAHVKQNYPNANVISSVQSAEDNTVLNAPSSYPAPALTAEKYSRYGVKLKGAGIYWIEKADLDRGMNAWNATRSTYRAVSRFKFAELLNTHSLYCKTDFTYTQSTPDHFFTEECILRSPSGKIARYQGQNFLEGKERNWNWFWYNPLGDLIQKMYGQAAPAETGIYTYELYFDGQLVGSASFAITN